MKGTTAFSLLLVAAALTYTVIMPQYSKVEARRAEAAQYEEVLNNVSDLSRKRDELLIKYNALPKGDVDKLKKILPDNVNVVELTLNIDAIASKYGISIKSIRTTESKANQSATVVEAPDSGPYQRVTLTFSFISSYENFRKFVRDLEQSLRIIEIRNITFTNNNDSSLNDYQMQIDTYWLK